MEDPFRYIYVTNIFILAICWLLFAFAYLFRQQPLKSFPRPRRPIDYAGLALQIIAFALVWGLRRPLDVNDAPLALQIAIGIFVIALSLGSIWIVLLTVRTLAKHWGYYPPASEDDHFVAEGPFCMVRHPLHTGLLGMLIASGLAVSYANILVIAVLLFLLGFFIRIRPLERTLRERFGDAFLNYTQSVPAILPGFNLAKVAGGSRRRTKKAKS